MMRLAATAPLAFSARAQNAATDPTSLASAGLNGDEACVNGALNTTWSALLTGTMTMTCSLATDQTACLYDDNNGQSELKDPPVCVVCDATAALTPLRILARNA